MAQSGRAIKHYQSDNGRFAENGFIDVINQKYQKINLCGFGAHHQNSIFENKNKNLTTGEKAAPTPWHENVAANDRRNVLDIFYESHF